MRTPGMELLGKSGGETRVPQGRYKVSPSPTECVPVHLGAHIAVISHSL